MRKVKLLMFATLSLFMFNAMAGEKTPKPPQPARTFELLEFDSTLQVHTVVKVNPDLKGCESQPSTLLYQDDAGQAHALVFQEVGKDCLN